MDNNVKQQKDLQTADTLGRSSHSRVGRNHRAVRALTEGAVIAALYVALTIAANALGLASMAIQVRFSEALCVLCFFTPAAVPGMTIGCLLANLVTGANIWDITFGSVATLLGMLGGWFLGVVARSALAKGRKRLSTVCKVLIPLPTVLANAFIVPLILIYAYGVPDAYWFLMLTVGAGEVISAWILGLLVLGATENAKIFKK